MVLSSYIDHKLPQDHEYSNKNAKFEVLRKIESQNLKKEPIYIHHTWLIFIASLISPQLRLKVVLSYLGPKSPQDHEYPRKFAKFEVLRKLESQNL